MFYMLLMSLFPGEGKTIGGKQEPQFQVGGGGGGTGGREPGRIDGGRGTGGGRGKGGKWEI